MSTLKLFKKKQILNTLGYSQQILNKIKQEYSFFKGYDQWIKTPTLGILKFEQNSNNTFCLNIQKKCKQLGFSTKTISLPQNVSLKKIKDNIQYLNNNSSINGIVIQLPLPKNLKPNFLEVINLISPEKDIDCMNFQNYGQLLFAKENKGFTDFPCVVKSIEHIVQQKNISLQGKQVVIIGQSYLVGYPSLIYFQQQNATVNFCNEYTQNLSSITKEADIIVTAAGVPHMITAKDIKQNSIIFDIGFTIDKQKKIKGDVDFEKCKDKAKLITPVLGGIGTLTSTMIVKQLWKQFLFQTKIGVNNQKYMKKDQQLIMKILQFIFIFILKFFQQQWILLMEQLQVFLLL